MLKPTLFYYLIPIIINAIFTVIFTFLGVDLLKELLKMNIQSVIESGIGTIIVAFIQIVLAAISSVLLNYGMAACITALKREEKITFLTIFRKIKENLGKVLSVFGRIILEGIVITLISILIVFGVSLLTQIDTIFVIVAVLIGTITLIVYLFKILELVFAEIFTNYIIYDYPNKSAKEIVKKAKEIVKKQSTKYGLLILSIVWILPFFTINMILSNLDMIIWQPEILTYWSIITDITTTAPAWWFWIVNLVNIVLNTLIFFKVISYTSSFYQSLCPERLFDEEYTFEKEKIIYLFIAIAVILFYVLAVFGIVSLWEKGYSRLWEWRYSNVTINSSNNSSISSDNNVDVNNVSVEDLKIEFAGITEYGDFVIKIKNTSKKVAYIDCVNTIFKDEKGEVIEEVKSSNSYFSIMPKSETYTYLYSYSKYGIDEEYQNYEFDVKLRDTTSWLFEEDVMLEKNQIVSKDTGKNITLEVKKRVDDLKVNTVFYRKNEIVGISDDIDFVVGEKSTYVVCDYASGKSWSSNLEFDRFEIFILKASEAEIEDDVDDKEIISKLDSKVETNTENETIIKLKNKNNQTVNISQIDMVIKDKKGNLIDIAIVNQMYFYIKSNDEIYLSCDKIEEFDKYSIEFYYELTKYVTYDDIEGDFKLDFNDNDEVLEVKFTNTLDITVDTIEISVVFFKDKKIVGYKEGTRTWKDVAPGETVTIEVSHPTKGWHEEIEYDDFEAKILMVES